MATETIFAKPTLPEDGDTWWAKKTLMQVLQENAQLRERLAKTKAALSYSEALLSSGEVHQPPLATAPPAAAASAAVRRPADPPAQPEKRQKLC